jgi:VanZ family protein
VRKVSLWGPVLGWMALIFFFSAQSQLPKPDRPWVDLILEKSAHFFEFVVLGALLVRALGVPKHGRARVFVATIAIAWVYALSDEIHQIFVPNRDADWLDVLFDWGGAALGAAIGLLWAAARANRKYVR